MTKLFLGSFSKMLETYPDNYGFGYGDVDGYGEGYACGTGFGYGNNCETNYKNINKIPNKEQFQNAGATIL